jgi:hypothetical protein
MKLPEGFRDAEALADFANLDWNDAQKLTYFRQNYPDFAPAEWWDYKTEWVELVPRVVPLPNSTDPINPAEHGFALEEELRPLWTVVQDDIHSCWLSKFQFESVFYLTQTLKYVFTAPTDMVQVSAHLYLPDGDLAVLSALKPLTYHKAVVFLNQHPKRAKICKACKKHFVANHPKREFCEYPDERGETCRQKNGRMRNLKNYHARGRKLRQKKNKRQGMKKQRMSSPRVPGFRRN